MSSTLVTLAIIVVLAASQTQSLHRFIKDGKYGFMDDDGTVRIEPRFHWAGFFAEGLARVESIAGKKVYRGGELGKDCFTNITKWGFIGPTGALAIPFDYDDAHSFSEGRAAVRVGAAWGYIDRNGLWLIPPRFEEAGDFDHGLARVTTKGRTGYVDTTGVLVSGASRGWSLSDPNPSSFNDPNVLDGLILFRHRDGRSLLRDSSGRIVVERSGTLRSLGEGLIAYGASSDGLLGLMDHAGTVITPPVWDHISRFSESLALVVKDRHPHFIDRTGSVVFQLDADGADSFHEGMAAARVGRKVGYVDRSGRMVVPPTFSRALSFSGGLAAVCIETGEPPAEREWKRPERCGFIDKTGAFVISPRFAEVKSFEGGWATAFDPVFGRPLQLNREGRIVARDEPRAVLNPDPFGKCVEPQRQGPLPPAAAAPRDYRVHFSLSSDPAGASVYLVPLWDWQRSESGARLLRDKTALDTYLVSDGVTPLTSLKLKSQVYMGVFDLGGKRKVVAVNVTTTGSRSVSVSF